MLNRKTVLGIIIIAVITVLRTSTTAWTGEATDVRAGEATRQVHTLTPVSLQLVDEAVAVLSPGWPNMSQDQRDTFLLLYDPANTGDVDAEFAVVVLGNYQQIRETLAGDLQVTYAPQNDTCQGKRLYFTDLSRLYVCPYFFEEENELRKARTLIHEMAHMALLVADRPYYRPTSKQYAKLTPNGSWMTDLPLVGRVLRELLRSDTLYHPDAYAHFALMNAGYTNIYASTGPVNLAISGNQVPGI